MKSRKKHQPIAHQDKLKKERRVSGKTGLPPGTLVHIGKVFTENVSVKLTEFDASDLVRKDVLNIGDLCLSPEKRSRWFEITGLQDTGIIDQIGKNFNISPMILEDILNTEHRPKFEELDGILFFTLKAFSINAGQEIVTEQASFILGSGFLISFQESDHQWFQPVRTMLENSTGKVRSKGLDFLLYSLLDVIIDKYYEVVELISDKLEDLEDLIFENPSQELLERNRLLRKDIITIRKALIPVLEAVNKLRREEPGQIDREELRYFDDIHDHIIQILDYTDTYREISAELKENYLSNITLRMNQVMKLLTIITTIFIPLSFIAGIYGMNFSNMPELTWKYGYFSILGFMLAVMIGMLIYFRRKKWM